MKTNYVAAILTELKSLRRKVKKSAEAQAKVEHKLAQVETLVKLLEQQADTDRETTKLGKKKKKANQPDVTAVAPPSTETNK